MLRLYRTRCTGLHRARKGTVSAVLNNAARIHSLGQIEEALLCGIAIGVAVSAKSVAAQTPKRNQLSRELHACDGGEELELSAGAHTALASGATP